MAMTTRDEPILQQENNSSATPAAPATELATATRRGLAPQFTAWLVLLGSFAIFCSLAYLVINFVNDLLSQSFEYREAHVQTVSERDANIFVLRRGQTNPILINGEEVIREGDEIRTDKTTEAVLVFFDGSRVEIAANSKIRLEESRVNIRNFRRTEKRLIIQVLDGQARVTLPQFVPAREFNRSVVKVVLPLENSPAPLIEVLLNDPQTGNYAEGLYTFSVNRSTENGIRAWLNNKGRKPVEVVNGLHKVTVAPGQRLAYEGNSLGEPGLPAERQVQLINNGSFINGVDSWKPQLDQGPDNGAIDGLIQFGAEQIDDGAQPRTRIVRLDPRAEGNFAETALLQQIDRDVSEYDELWFSLKMNLVFQSLPGGGQEGAEYPLFVKIYYLDKTGNQQELFWGFYSRAADNYTLVQDQLGRSFKLPQDEWQEKRWNLMELRNKPSRILKIVVGSAGHLYDSYFTDVSLIGR